MKRLIVAAILLAAVTAACVLTNLTVTRNTDELIGRIDRIEQLYTGGDRETCTALTDRFVEEFRAKTRFFPFFMRHADISQIEETAVTLPVILRYEEGDHFVSELIRCRNQLEKLASLEQPTPENIL